MHRPLTLLMVLSGVTFAAASEEAGLARIRAVDGADSLRLDSYGPVRLAGLHVPPGQALAASDALSDLLARGEQVQVHLLDGPFDRYGRRRVRIEAPAGRSLAAWLVERGLAVVQPEPALRLDFVDLLAHEERARRAGRGIWSQTADGPLAPAASAGRLIGRYGVVEGRIHAVGSTDHHVYLNFDEDWRSDFTIRIRRPELNDMAGRWVEDVERLAGRTVRARGVVIEAGGPLIEVSHPEQIEVLR